MAKKTKKDPCWEGYEQAGTKKKEGKTVPNCIKTPSDKKQQQKSVTHLSSKSYY